MARPSDDQGEPTDLRKLPPRRHTRSNMTPHMLDSQHSWHAVRQRIGKQQSASCFIRNSRNPDPPVARFRTLARELGIFYVNLSR